jgi:hypothetical protein
MPRCMGEFRSSFMLYELLTITLGAEEKLAQDLIFPA